MRTRQTNSCDDLRAGGRPFLRYTNQFLLAQRAPANAGGRWAVKPRTGTEPLPSIREGASMAQIVRRGKVRSDALGWGEKRQTRCLIGTAQSGGSLGVRLGGRRV
jgi:hypothetical protein